MTLGETEIIQRFFLKDSDGSISKKRRRNDVAIGIGDDAAALRVPAGMELLSAIDTIVEGVHFPLGFAAADTGYRVLAVNLSDLAAMGAEPAWALLSLSMPVVDEDWLESFCDGFFGLADQHNVALVGGDLVKGPLSATVTALGYCPQGAAIKRSGAMPGELVFVTGSPGAAARGLRSIMHPETGRPEYEACFRRPKPRVREGIALRGIATSMIDISDGLLKDAGHIAASSNVQIQFDAEALGRVANGDLQAALSGGDDYELCFTIPAVKKGELAAMTAGWECVPQQVGSVETGSGVVMPGHDLSACPAYDHFA